MTRLETLLSYLEKEPNDSFLNYALALEYHKAGDTLKAIELIVQLIARDEKYLGAYYQLGKLYEEQNKLTDAIAIYKKGKAIAAQLNDRKTLGELSEALLMIDEEEA